MASMLKKIGPVGFEPTTKGFTLSVVSDGSGLSLHPRHVTWGTHAVGCGTLWPVIKGAQSPQVVSAPSGGAPPAWLRIAMREKHTTRAKVSLNSSRPLHAFPREGTIESMSPLH